MTIKELLKLDIKSESIKKVDSFLASTIRNSEEYFRAISFKSTILHNIGKTNDALKLLYSFIPFFTDLDSNGIILILKIKNHMHSYAPKLWKTYSLMVFHSSKKTLHS